MKTKPNLNLEKFVFFIPMMGYFTLFLILIETFTYPGFLSKYILFSSKTFSVIYLFISLILIFLNNNNNKRIVPEILFSLNYIFVPIFLFTYLILYLEEFNNYPNYVFSSYHVHIEQVRVSLLFLLGLLVIDIFQKYKLIIINQISSFFGLWSGLNKTQNCIIFIILLIYIILNALNTTDSFLSNFFVVITKPTLSYEEKQELKIPLYKYMMFIKANTRSNSKILIPPQQSPWLTIGNAGIVRYFLYPREILVGEYDTNNFKSADYVLLTRGSWHTNDKSMYGWPRENIYNAKITFYNLESEDSTLLTTTDYIFKPNSEISNKWGLIEVLQ